MEKKKYLYGASVQGIQSFIFKTNKLAEIVGASEIVEQICTQLFYDAAKINKENTNIILSAAGNIKYIFDGEQKCKDFVFIFPKTVMESAPGITISQAVVSFEGDEVSEAIEQLELKLKAQRNRVVSPPEIGFMGLERSRRTGGVAVEFVEKEARDAATKAKLAKKDESSLFAKMAGKKTSAKEFPFDIKDITASGKNSWIAVIHADGNGLGKIIQNKGKELNANGKFKAFSEAIENSTQNAIRMAFEEVVEKENTNYKHYPIRPVVIGGDDVTVIIRADLALDFTDKFLRYFERESEKEFTKLDLLGYEKGLTACAGIAYVKESYPLHYALHLAENLCTDAKKKVKDKNVEPKYSDIPKSALAFYKVQESFIDDLSLLKARTLKTTTGLDYFAGPYLLDEIIQIKDKLEIIKEEADKNDKSKATGKLRQIVSETYKDTSTAIFMMERMKEVNNDFYKKLNLDDELKAIKENTQSQLFDLLTLHSFKYGNREN